ncbi:hypothetical protein [Brevundimonas diminuta]|uniref:hypothetical protein n=1 Tax=Brevundimonas diminuta TaxID=293 RepID=UPI003D9A9E5B
MMKSLLLSVALPALMLAAAPALAESVASDPAAASATNPPPHFPRDLSPEGVKAADDHLALEEVDGAEARAFVAASNEKALAALTGDRRYEPFRQQAEAILTATDRIPGVSFLGEGLGNFWQDAANPKGVWRRTTLASYRTAQPQWETLLDIDALAKAEGKDWVFKGANCLAPDETRCLINLSDGGKDAVTVREFDLTTKRFVDGGFVIPEGKHRISWLDRDTLLIATDFGPGSLTESGYPFIVKSLTRGHPLAHATEVYRGQQGDGGYGVSPMVFRDKAGAVEAVLFSRPLDTFRSEIWALGSDGKPYRLNLPERVAVQGVLGDKLIFSPEQAWSFDGQDYAAGSLVAMPMGVLGDVRQSIRIDAKTASSGRASVPAGRQGVRGQHRRRDRRQRRRHAQTLHAGCRGLDRCRHPRFGQQRRGSGRQLQGQGAGLRLDPGLPDAADPQPGRCRQRRPERAEVGARQVRRLDPCGRAVRGRLDRRDEDPLLRHPAQESGDGRDRPDHPVRLRRFPGQLPARLQARDGQAVA